MEDVKNKCYICIENPKEPIYPAGCTHPFCKKHLKARQYKNLTTFRIFKN